MAKLESITRVPVHFANWALLALILIATPIIASRQFLGVEATSTLQAQRLMIGGFCLAILVNFFGALTLFRRSRKLRRLCWEWSVVHAAFAVVLLLVLQGVLHFEWLREWLEWVGGQFG